MEEEFNDTEEYLSAECQAYRHIRDGTWSLEKFKEWQSYEVGQAVKLATEYLQTTIEMMKESK